MSWLRPKDKTATEPDHDPCIDNAREVLGNSQTETTQFGRRRDRTADLPRGIDATFCYGGETNPCA